MALSFVPLIRTQDLIAWCGPIDGFGAISSKAGIHGEPGMWFHHGSPGKWSTLIVGQSSTAVEAFSISQINVICSYAVFEPDFKLVVTLSLTCGTYDPAETTEIQKMEFENISLKYFTKSF